MKTKPKSKKALAQARLNRAAVAWAKTWFGYIDARDDDGARLLRAVRAFQKASAK